MRPSPKPILADDEPRTFSVTLIVNKNADSPKRHRLEIDVPYGPQRPIEPLYLKGEPPEVLDGHVSCEEDVDTDREPVDERD